MFLLLGLQTKYLFLEQRRVLRGEVVNTFGLRLKVVKICPGCPSGGAAVEPELSLSPATAGAWLLPLARKAPGQRGPKPAGPQPDASSLEDWGRRVRRDSRTARTRAANTGYVFFRLSAVPTAWRFRFFREDAGLATAGKTLYWQLFAAIPWQAGLAPSPPGLLGCFYFSSSFPLQSRAHQDRLGWGLGGYFVPGLRGYPGLAACLKLVRPRRDRKTCRDI